MEVLVGMLSGRSAQTKRLERLASNMASNFRFNFNIEVLFPFFCVVYLRKIELANLQPSSFDI